MDVLQRYFGRVLDVATPEQRMEMLAAFARKLVALLLSPQHGPKGKKRGPKGKMIAGKTRTEAVYDMVAVQHLSYRSIAKGFYGEDTKETRARVRSLYSRAKRMHEAAAVPPQ
jgi:hypothetical protein